MSALRLVEASPRAGPRPAKDVAQASDRLEANLQQHDEKLGYVDDVVRPQLGDVEGRLEALESNISRKDCSIFEQRGSNEAAIATTKDVLQDVVEQLGARLGHAEETIHNILDHDRQEHSGASVSCDDHLME